MNGPAAGTYEPEARCPVGRRPWRGRMEDSVWRGIGKERGTGTCLALPQGLVFIDGQACQAYGDHGSLLSNETPAFRN